jgi:hypothetical protein
MINGDWQLGIKLNKRGGNLPAILAVVTISEERKRQPFSSPLAVY